MKEYVGIFAALIRNFVVFKLIFDSLIVENSAFRTRNRAAARFSVDKSCFELENVGQKLFGWWITLWLIYLYFCTIFVGNNSCGGEPCVRTNCIHKTPRWSHLQVHAYC